MNKTEEKTVRITINELSKSYCYAMARVAELEKALCEILNDMDCGMEVGACSDCTHYTIAKTALDGKGGI